MSRRGWTHESLRNDRETDAQIIAVSALVALVLAHCVNALRRGLYLGDERCSGVRIVASGWARFGGRVEDANQSVHLRSGTLFGLDETVACELRCAERTEVASGV